MILFEYDKPLDRERWINFEPGIWEWTLSPGDVSFLDDRGNTVDYAYKNSTKYNIKSVTVDGEKYTKVDTLADCRTINKCFYYDTSTTKIYVHFDDFDPPLGKLVYIGAAQGTSYGAGGFYHNNIYYSPRLTGVMNLARSKDPLFYGLISFESGTVTNTNDDGFFDDWRSQNLFRQPARILMGDGDYSTFRQMYEGFIGNDSTTWSSFSVELTDIRASFTQPIAKNRLTQDEFPNMKDDNVDKPKPVGYGQVYSVDSLCLNDEESSPTVFTFMICDTEFNSPASLDSVTVDGTSVTPDSIDLANGTFNLLTADCFSGGVKLTDKVRHSFTMSITDGVEIVKDLMENYAGYPYVDYFWDITDADLASSWNTSLYIDDDAKLQDGLESVLNDINAVLFTRDSGKLTIRTYDNARTPLMTIQADQFSGEPDISNNGDEFLTSVSIAYKYNHDTDSRVIHENVDYYDSTFATYKSARKETIETMIYELSAAVSKSEAIMEISNSITDIVRRTVRFTDITDPLLDIDIMDFVICDPVKRPPDSESLGIWEVLGRVINPVDLSIELTLRYVSTYTPVITTYSAWVDELGNNITDENGNTFILAE